MHVRITLQLGENVLAQDVSTGLPAARGLYDNDVVALLFQGSPLAESSLRCLRNSRVVL